MKILWVCNILLPDIANQLSLPVTPVGGWITGMLHGLQKKISESLTLGICCPRTGIKAVERNECNSVSYFCFPSEYAVITSEMWFHEWFEKIIDEFRPEILHIFGTEYAHSLAAAKVFSKPEKTLVNIQGLCFESAQYYCNGLSRRVIHGFNLHDILRGGTLKRQQRSFEKRGKNEIQLLNYVNHVIGRTDWDKACVTQINPKLKYHFCNETLRDSFYSGKWQLNSCERFSIFTSVCGYPIKGFHLLLKAMPIILSQFPETKLYVTGANPYNTPMYKRSAYVAYLVRLIDKFKLRHTVIFCGTLSEQQMKERFLAAHVFVSASYIENESNSLSEAKILGVPCVASYVGGVTNRMEHGVDGYFYQVDSIRMLAYFVSEIFRNDNLTLCYSANAVKNSTELHDPNRNTERLYEIYRSLAQNC